MANFEFHNPWFLALFFLLIPIFIRDIRGKESKAVAIPSIQNMKEAKGYATIRKLLSLLKYLFLSSLIIAMARPRTFSIHTQQDDTQGVDILLSVDVSLSMLAKDLEPDRLTALKNIAMQFVDKRMDDRIGLVAYSGEAFTKVPLTTDHQVVIDELENLNPMELEPGTAIGEGLSVAVNHLKNSRAKSKIIILMTDGVNTIENAMNPNVAALLAKDLGIKVYAIGIGTNGYALMPTQTDIFGNLIFTENEVKIDEETLQNIAQKTGGKYFRATSNESLKQIYNEIDSLEKTKTKRSKTYSYDEYFRVFLLIALGILLLEVAMHWGLVKSIG